MAMELEDGGARGAGGMGHQGGARALALVLDAANVCWQLVRSQPGWTEARAGPGVRPPMVGLQEAVQFWRRFGVEPVAICPAWWERVREQGRWGPPDWEAADAQVMDQLRREGVLYPSPAGEHDDLYIIDYTFRMDGFLVSNDKYRDHQRERNLPEDWIEERRIGFMFVRNAFLPNPDGIARLEQFCAANNISPAHSGPAIPLLPPPPPAGAASSTAAMPSGGAIPAPYAFSGHHQTMTPAPGVGIGAHTASAVGVEELSVPAAAVPFIIGRQGAKVNQIRDASGAQIDVVSSRSPLSGTAMDHDDHSGQPSEPTAQVRLTGSCDARTKARELIEEVLDFAERKRNRPPRTPPANAITSAPSAPEPIRFARADPVGMPVNFNAGTPHMHDIDPDL